MGLKHKNESSNEASEPEPEPEPEPENNSGFHCLKCGKEFNSEQGLKVHIGLAHKVESSSEASETETKSGFQCQICHTVMTKRYNLKQHIVNVHRISVADAESYIGTIQDKSTDAEVESSLENSNYVQATVEDMDTSDTTVDNITAPDVIDAPPIGQVIH